MSARSWLINIDDPAANGLLQTRDSSLPLAEQQFFRSASEIVTLYPLKQSASGLFQPLDISSLSTLRIGVGLKSETATGGTFGVTVGGYNNGTNALAFDVSAAALQTALNANSGVIAAGTTVSVLKVGSLYRITCDTANIALSITAQAEALTPQSDIVVSTSTSPGVGIKGVYSIEIVEAPFAYTASWTPQDPNSTLGTFTANTSTDILTFSSAVVSGNRYRVASSGTLPAGLSAGVDYYALSSGTTSKLSRWPGGTAVDITTTGSGTHTAYNHANGVTLQITDNGTATTPGAYKVFIDPAPLSGALSFSWQQRQSVLVTCSANNPVNARWLITNAPDNSAGASVWQNNYVDFQGTGNVTKRYWFKQGGSGTAPSTPTGGTLTAVDYAASDFTGVQMLAFLVDKMIASGQFDGSYVGATFAVINTTTGGFTSTPSTNIAGLTITTQAQGVSGVLVGKTFTLNDRTGTVGVWMNDGTLSNPPANALACNRQIEVTLAGGETSTAVATASVAVLAADAEFTPSTSSGAVITATNTNAGAIGTTFTPDAGFSEFLAKQGYSIYAVFDSGADAVTVQNLMGSAFTVTKAADYAWTFVHTSLGTIDPPTASDVTLEFPVGIDVAISFATESLAEAFAANSGADIDATLEIKAANTGEAEVIWLQTTATLTTDLLRTDTTIGPIPPGYLVAAPAHAYSPGTRGQIAMTTDALFYCFETGDSDGTERWREIIGTTF